MQKGVALYTACYPGAEKYLSGWRDSLLCQSDPDFTVCMSLDNVDRNTVLSLVGPNPILNFIETDPGDTPAELRSKALMQLTDQFEILILVDIDDLLLPSRVSSAKKMLKTSELNCCAMIVIDSIQGKKTHFFYPTTRSTEIVRKNVLGLTNSAWRSDVLKECLPLPSNCVLVDWLFATRAHAKQTKTSYDYTPRMVYRQHSGSITRIIPPFSRSNIIDGCKLTLQHYSIAIEESFERYPLLTRELQLREKEVKEFMFAIQQSNSIMQKYLDALNVLPLGFVWWDYIAHPKLEKIWQR